MARSAAGEKWLSVSEAGRALGLSRTSLLVAEDAGLLTPVRTPGGHRRYRPDDLRRYLHAAGARDGTDPAASTAQQAAALHPHAGGAPDTTRESALDLGLAMRAAVRPLVQALEAECGGVYLLQDATLRFCAAFGVPRWLTERLAESEPPAPLTRALDTRRPQLFDPAAAGFPEPRSAGHGVAVALRHDDQAIGVLFVVRVAPPLPGELRTVGAFAELVTLMVADRARITDLEHRLARIASLTTA